VTGPVPQFVRRRRVADRLRAAADLLATNGWIQGQPSDEHDRYCMAGALYAVTDAEGVYLAASQAVREHLNDLDATSWGLVSWNDRAGRTAEQVIAVLRETAAEEDALAAALEAKTRPAGEPPR
jgi:hypothetical protein